MKPRPCLNRTPSVSESKKMPSRHNRGPSTAIINPPATGSTRASPRQPRHERVREEQSCREADRAEDHPAHVVQPLVTARVIGGDEPHAPALDTALSHRSLGVGHQPEAHTNAGDDDRHENQPPRSAQSLARLRLRRLLRLFRSPRRPDRRWSAPSWFRSPRARRSCCKPSRRALCSQTTPHRQANTHVRTGSRYPPWPGTTRYASSTWQRALCSPAKRQVTGERKACAYRVEREWFRPPQAM